MRYLGMTLIFLAAFGISRALTRNAEKRLSEAEGYLAFLSFLQGELTRYARPVNEWSRLFSDGTLEESGFLPHLRAHGDLCAAFTASATRLGEEEKKLLSSLFSAFGRGYREEVLASLAATRAALSETVGREREELPKTLRVVRTLSAAGALALVILLL